MEPILEDLERAVEALEDAREKSSAKLGTRLMVSEQLSATRKLRDRVVSIIEEERQ